MKGTYILRFGLAVVFAYFCFMQIKDPVLFTSYLPRSLQSSSAVTFVYANAIVDGVLAVCMITGLLGRFAALIATIHLLAIAITMGFNDVAVRDFGLAMACLALVLIHEEHIPWRQRLILNKFFGGH